jgi:MerR-like DNA binding protein
MLIKLINIKTYTSVAEHRLLTAARLGVSRAMLYAYVSRGLIHAHPAQDDPRRRLYSATDIRRLLGNKTRGRKAVDIAVATLDYGPPDLFEQYRGAAGYVDRTALWRVP